MKKIIFSLILIFIIPFVFVGCAKKEDFGNSKSSLFNNVKYVEIQDNLYYWTEYRNVEKCEVFENGVVFVYMNNGEKIVTHIENVIIHY